MSPKSFLTKFLLKLEREIIYPVILAEKFNTPRPNLHKKELNKRTLF